MESKVGGTKRHQKCGWWQNDCFVRVSSVVLLSHEPSKPSPLPSPYHPSPHFGHNVPADSLDTPTPLLPLWCPKRCQQDIDVEGWNPRCKRQEQDRQYNQFHRDQPWMLVRFVQGILGNEGEQKRNLHKLLTNHDILNGEWEGWNIIIDFSILSHLACCSFGDFWGSKISLALGMEAVLPHKYFHLSEGTSGMSFWEGLISDNIDPFVPFFNHQNPSC